MMEAAQPPCVEALASDLKERPTMLVYLALALWALVVVGSSAAVVLYAFEKWGADVEPNA